MKRMNIPDELKRFTDPGPGTADAGEQPEGGSPAAGEEGDETPASED